MRMRRVCVQARMDADNSCSQQQAAAPRASTCSYSLWTSSAAILACFLVALCAHVSLMVSADVGSSTGVPQPRRNLTTSSGPDEDDVYIPGLPVSNTVAIGAGCGAIVAVCVCLFLCARQQMKQSTARKPGAKGASGLSPQMQAKLEAARRGWRKSDVDAGGADVGGVRGPAFDHADAQRAAMALLVGAGLGGLGACRYSDFAPEDFEGEAWATAPNVESLRRSGAILDVVLAARQSAVLSAWSALVSFVISGLLPFHKQLCAMLRLADWYGEITEVEFARCLIISCAGMAVHAAAVFLARRTYNYDRQPSIVKEREAQRLAIRLAAQKLTHVATDGSVAVVPGSSATSPSSAALPSSPPPAAATGPATVTRMGTFLSNGHTLTAPSTIARSYTMNTQPRGSMAKATAAGGSAAEDGVNSGAEASSATSPSAAAGAAALPSTIAAQPVLGRDPPCWPLGLLCICTLLSYALLGFQSYLSWDESIGRRYGWSDVPRALWPEARPRGPFITLLVCVGVGAVAVVPLGLTLRLAALLKPRKVHPHLMAPQQLQTPQPASTPQ